MVTALETEWTRPSLDTQMGHEDFDNILRTRIETIVFREETERFFAENSDSVMQAFNRLRLSDNVLKGHPFGVVS